MWLSQAIGQTEIRPITALPLQVRCMTGSSPMMARHAIERRRRLVGERCAWLLWLVNLAQRSNARNCRGLTKGRGGCDGATGAIDQPSQDGERRASSTNSGSTCGGRLIQAWNAPQSFAGIQTTDRLSISLSSRSDALSDRGPIIPEIPLVQPLPQYPANRAGHARSPRHRQADGRRWHNRHGE